jgi:hypothetical protein
MTPAGKPGNGEGCKRKQFPNTLGVAGVKVPLSELCVNKNNFQLQVRSPRSGGIFRFVKTRIWAGNFPFREDTNLGGYI